MIAACSVHCRLLHWRPTGQLFVWDGVAAYRTRDDAILTQRVVSYGFTSESACLNLVNRAQQVCPGTVIAIGFVHPLVLAHDVRAVRRCRIQRFLSPLAKRIIATVQAQHQREAAA
jgi:hypothetical protein